MSVLEDQIQRGRDWFERLTERERRVLGGGGAFVIVFIALGLGGYIFNSLSTFSEQNAQMRTALKDIEVKRDGYLKSKAKLAYFEGRLNGSGGVKLQGYLEQAAKESGIEIPDQKERPPQPAGHNYTERAVDLSLRQVKLDALTAFLKKIETGPTLVVVTALNIKTRDDRHVELDVTMTVSTYERTEKKEKSGSKKDKT